MTRRFASHRLMWAAIALFAALPILFSSAARAGDPKPAKDTPLPAVFDKAAPEEPADLKAIQDQLKKVVDKVMPCVVNVRDDKGQGSGVIVSEDGYVLTAGHVSGLPGRKITLTLHDGKTVKARTLGHNKTIDSGLLKIEGEGKWPHVDMGKSGDLKEGQWVVTIGHPGGLKKDRGEVVRLGRVQRVTKDLIQTDCTIVGGDSGGPLFDMSGKVVGIHSRIAGALSANIHVPIDTYTGTWERLTRGELWPFTPFLGFQVDRDAEDCKVDKVLPGTPADKGGLKVGDVIVSFGGTRIESFEELGTQLKKAKFGEEVTLRVKRGEKTLELKVVIGDRSERG